MPRLWVAVLETLAVAALLVAGAAGFLVWRLMQGPIDLGFARDYIEEALRNEKSGIRPELEDIVLSWPELRGPLLLGFKNVRLFDRSGAQTLTVEKAALSLSKTALLVGRITPLALILDRPSLTIFRAREGSIGVGIADLNAYGPFRPAPKSTQADLVTRVLGYVARGKDIRDGSPLSGLRAFRVVDALVIIEDEALGRSWSLPRLNASLESGPQGFAASAVFNFAGVNAAKSASFFQMNIDLPENASIGRVTAELRDFDPWFFAQSIPGVAALKPGDAIFSAQVAAAIDPSFRPLKADIHLASGEGKFFSPVLSDKDTPYENLDLNLTYDAAKGALRMDKSSITVNGVPLKAEADGFLKDGTFAGKTRLSIDRLPQKKIAELWPPSLKEDAAEEWIVGKLSDGVFTNLYFDAALAAAYDRGGFKFGAKNLEAGFAFENMTVNYRPPLWPVKNGRGKGRFIVDQERLNIAVDGGTIGDLKIKAGELEFANIIEHGKGIANIYATLEGPVKSGLEYAALEPISMKRKYDLGRVKGNASIAVNLDFPTHKHLKKEEVKVQVKGTMSDVLIPAVLKDLDLTGGPYALDIGNDRLRVTGKGAVGGATGTIDYEEDKSADKETVDAALLTTPDMRARLGADIGAFVDGALPTAVHYESSGGTGTAGIKADLTPAAVFLAPFGYRKDPGTAGTASMKASFENGSLRALENFEIAAPELSLRKGALSFLEKNGKTELTGGAFPEFSIGASRGSMNFSVDASGRYAIKAAAPVFDLGPFLSRNKRKKIPYDDPPMKIDLTAETMKGADGSALRNGSVKIDIDSQGRYDEFRFAARQGENAIAIDYGPYADGIRAFSMHADNAGAALAALGAYENMRGGTLNIQGRTEPDDRDVKGEAEINDFKVVNAPTLARLVGALSLPGLAQLLNSDGLAFTRLKSGFLWRYKPGGSVLTIEDGRTSGNSVGFSFDGDVDIANSALKVQGTMVPLSGINKILGKIPLVGEILTGGNGLIAATFSVKGPAQKPDVMVNPLSVLAPGILRRILFEN